MRHISNATFKEIDALNKIGRWQIYPIKRGSYANEFITFELYDKECMHESFEIYSYEDIRRLKMLLDSKEKERGI